MVVGWAGTVGPDVCALMYVCRDHRKPDVLAKWVGVCCGKATWRRGAGEHRSPVAGVQFASINVTAAVSAQTFGVAAGRGGCRQLRPLLAVIGEACVHADLYA